VIGSVEYEAASPLTCPILFLFYFYFYSVNHLFYYTYIFQHYHMQLLRLDKWFGGIVETPTMSESDSYVITVPPPETETEALVKELYQLRLERIHIEEKINRLLGSLPDGMSNVTLRPLWGPCTRCGHTWRGHWRNLPPRGCPRCGSSGWRVESTRPDARHPGDPPNPRWQKNRITGKPTDPENVFGRKTGAATRAAKRIHENKRRQRREEAARKHNEERDLRRAAVAANTAANIAASASARFSKLTPPPRLDDVAAAAVASVLPERPTMVASPSVRFAEAPSNSVPRETILEEPADGVPVRIAEDGTLTPLIPGIHESTDDELLEAINDSGLVANDDGAEEEDPDGHDSQ
jgi:predicted  nucleic acid-binding Zn-ribbon protein